MAHVHVHHVTSVLLTDTCTCLHNHDIVMVHVIVACYCCVCQGKDEMSNILYTFLQLNMMLYYITRCQAVAAECMQIRSWNVRAASIKAGP